MGTLKQTHVQPQFLVTDRLDSQDISLDIRKLSQDDNWLEKPSRQSARGRRNRSKAGCYTCRLKRKKCDEATPKCGPCVRHQLKCIWPSKGVGQLTKEMREKMKRDIDLSEDISGDAFEGGSSDLFFISDSGIRYYVEYASDCGEPKMVLSSSAFATTNSYRDNEQTGMPQYEDSSNPPILPVSSQPTWTSAAPPVNGALRESNHSATNEEWLALLNTPQPGPDSPSLALLWERNANVDANTITSRSATLRGPTPSNLSAADATNTTHDEDYNAYGLDEELSEKFYAELMRKFVHWSTSPREVSAASAASLLSQYQLTQQELLLYYTSIHYFLPAVGPQQTLPQLTTTETFVPLLTHHPIVKDVFLCCGATFLAWCQPHKYSSVAEKLYQKCRGELHREIESKSIRGDETWAFACFQLLCLTNKLHNGQGESMVDRCIENLTHSFQIIQLKYNDIEKHGSTATDRMLIESFIYNYTVSLLVARDLSKLPNPFGQVFHKLTALLKSPLFNDCDVEWMNNPVLGPSLDAFCLLAKVSYLSRMPLPLQSSEWKACAKELLEECLYYTPPTLPEPVRRDERKYEIYRPGLLCGSIISKACYLLLSKILQFREFDVRDCQIQGVVKYTIQSLKDIEKGNPLLCILLWSLLIIGAFTIDPEDRLVIKEYLKSTSETIHSYGALKITNLLQLVWDREDIELLFVRENICQIII
ncbi:LADA_0F14136g1_1 [Lachancea dasiensis]|uniref:LADA_0F14136g1_1 n=1 Tax=Lachancea dasiensis TaxID=1072105 RepID=A0A1G4JN31_9SACH|nr:LADA_0F14136g1_1 [Lachancea dasiensis]